MHFCWIGAVAPQLTAYLAPEIEAALATGRVHLPGFQSNMSDWLSAADVFALTSREDPFPSVALEAMASGISVAAFAGSGGIASLLEAAGQDAGSVVPLSDTGALAQALMALAAGQDSAQRPTRAAAATARFDFAAYTAELLAELRDPLAPRISAVVPSHNYARFMPERLRSIFTQTHPVEEVIVLDDGSTDDSVAVARAVALDWRRTIRLEAQATNGGNVFLQWQRAALIARGDYLWIAEADDSAHPELLARLAAMLAAHPDIDIAFCDSHAVNDHGETMMADYKEYYRSIGPGLLARDGVFSADVFVRDCLSERNTILNASAVVFRTQALRDALARCANELPQWKVAGDWRLYVDILGHSTGRVGYLAAPLNTHRRHRASATATLPAPAMLAEIGRMHDVVNALLPADTARVIRQTSYRHSLAKPANIKLAAAEAPPGLASEALAHQPPGAAG